MSDLISRLSELRSQYSCFDENERDAYHTLSDAIKELKAQSITLDNISNAYENGYQQGKFEAQQWIPVSDRLPDKDFTDFLVQIGHGKYAVYETAYRVRGRWVFYSDRIDGDGQSVIAWMECPEPYKENEL